MSKLLIDERPLIVLPRLAAAIGLYEAMVLQQVHFWLGVTTPDDDGRAWVRKTYGQWRDDLPFCSIDTIKRTIRTLEGMELLISTNLQNRQRMDRTKRYTINYAKLSQIAPHRVNLHDHEGKLPSSSVQPAPMSSGQIAPSDIRIRQEQDNNKNIYIPPAVVGIYTFAEFWNDFPRKRKQAEAEQAWSELNPDAELQAAIREGLKRAKNSTDWEAKKFIPKPSTWLTERGWEDEYVARGTNAVLKATPDPVPTPAEPEKEKREYSEEEKAQNSRKLREALKGVDLNANRTQPA